MTMIIKRGVVTKPGTDDKKYPETQVKSSGSTSNMELLYPYGSHGSPPVNSIAAIFMNEGKPDSKMGIAYEPDLRPKNLKDGEYECGNFVIGSTVLFREDGSILVSGNDLIIEVDGDANITVTGTTKLNSTGDVTVTCPKLTVDGDFQVTGKAEFTTDIESAGVNIGDQHKHDKVQTGGSNSGTVV